MAVTENDIRIRVGGNAAEVSARLLRPAGAAWLYVMAHGAGAGMDHPFLEAIAARLAAGRIATLRYQFPYMESGRRRPDSRSILLATVRSAVAAAAERAPDLRLLAGGKSMGGRMTSQAAASEPLPAVEGLVFLGFPLHPAGKPATDRADHLERVGPPMLFLQGTRDRLADLDLLRPVCARLGGRADLHIVDGADHSFGVLKRSGRGEDEVLEELAGAVRAFSHRLEGA